MKRCFKCGTEKPIADFYSHPKMADGYLNKCKDCAKKDARNHRIGERGEAIRAYDRARAKLPHRKQHAKLVITRWIENYPNRRAAHVVIGNAVRSGKIFPLPCFVCGQKAEAHHPDYSRPLDVVWLCPMHHKQAHAMAMAA